MAMAASDLPKEYAWILQYRDVPFNVMRNGFRLTVANHLNPRMYNLVGTRNVSPDWLGLAELLGVNNVTCKNLETKSNPCEELMRNFVPSQMKLTPFLELLCDLDRFDVLDETKKNIEMDVKDYRERETWEAARIQDRSVSTSSTNELTSVLIGDREGSPRLFDAYVSYCDSPKSVAFVKKLIANLEQRPDPVKLCIPGRDQLVGSAEYHVTAHIIEARCKRMIVLLDNEYLKSEHCDFQLKFAQALSPGAQKKRIIPIVIDHNVSIPSVLTFVTLCDWTREDLRAWFWDRLYHSIKPNVDRLPESDVQQLRTISMSQISLKEVGSSFS